MRNAAETREKLLDTATRLIWQSNYSSVGVNEICKQAGVTKGAFYYHFETKADLYVAASRHYWGVMKADLDAIFTPSFSPLEQLENLIRLILDKQETESEHADLEVVGCPFFTSAGQAGAEEVKVRMAALEMEDHGAGVIPSPLPQILEDVSLSGELRGGGPIHAFAPHLDQRGRIAVHPARHDPA